MKTLIIVGCGPKATAIATKAHVLKKLGWKVPEIIILEKNGPVANWDGTNGYTNGHLLLGTPPTEDVGFPYASSFGPQINAELLKYSYIAYRIDQKDYAEWIDRGQVAPSHSMFADYFKWVIKKLDQKIISGEVINISQKDKKWLVEYKNDLDTKQIEGDGIVITGPGRPKEFPRAENSQADEQNRVYNGQTIWKNIEHFNGLRDSKLAVIGAGETAAAIVTGLLTRIDESSKIDIITRHPMLFSRNEHWIEVMYFSTARNWDKLSNNEKLEVLRHADRGTFSPPTKNLIDSSYNVDIKIGSTQNIEINSEQVIVNIIEQGQESKLNYDYVIEATGFNSLSFVDYFSDKSFLEEKQSLHEKINHDLSLDGIFPPLHLPGLAAINQGPGFPHLSCLGLVADRILSSYVVK